MTGYPTPHLPLARYQLTFQASGTRRAPGYAGSAWRGGFGHALKRLVCVTREPTCTGCRLIESCLYPYVFETPTSPDVGKLRKYTVAPHPFVLTPVTPEGVADCGDAGPPAEPGAERWLQLTLFGHGNRHLPHVVHALDLAGQRGIQGSRLQLSDLAQAVDGRWQAAGSLTGRLSHHPPTAPITPPCPARLTLQLETPLRCKSHEHLMTPDTFSFAALFGTLLRRISLLTAYHTDTPLETDFAGLTRKAQTAAVVESADLRWHEWARYSTRQNTPLKMGGLLGSITLRGEGLAPFWPYLWLGQWTHAGKASCMGLGRYRVVDGTSA